MTPNMESRHSKTFRYDFHCHSTASDGHLSPSALVELAAKNQVEWLALTDHDTHAGLEDALRVCRQHSIRLVPAAEWSLGYKTRDYHVIGLNVDPSAAAMKRMQQSQQTVRRSRAIAIGQRLDRAATINDSYHKACSLADSDAPGRPWFARVLIAEGCVRDQRHAFNRFLKKGQAAFVKTAWIGLEEGITNIRSAGGIAVLAHPQHYGLTRSKLRRLLQDFKQLGGRSMEVAMPNLTLQQHRLLTDCCNDFELLASGGSDFHSPEQRWLKLGEIPDLSANLTPVWSAF